MKEIIFVLLVAYWLYFAWIMDWVICGLLCDDKRKRHLPFEKFFTQLGEYHYVRAVATVMCFGFSLAFIVLPVSLSELLLCNNRTILISPIVAGPAIYILIIIASRFQSKFRFREIII